jgi:hypothetical protein
MSHSSLHVSVSPHVFAQVIECREHMPVQWDVLRRYSAYTRYNVPNTDTANGSLSPRRLAAVAYVPLLVSDVHDEWNVHVLLCRSEENSL